MSNPLEPLQEPALEARVRAALDGVRPGLQADGGDLEFLGLARGQAGTLARVRLHGACKSCPAQPVTLRHAVEATLRAAVPEIAGLHVEEPAPAKRSWNIY